MKKKRFIAAALTGILCIGILSGCSETNKISEERTTEGQPSLVSVGGPFLTEVRQVRDLHSLYQALILHSMAEYSEVCRRVTIRLRV